MMAKHKGGATPPAADPRQGSLGRRAGGGKLLNTRRADLPCSVFSIQSFGDP